MVRQRISIKFGGEAHYPKLIGAFVLVVAVLLFFKAGAEMFDSWEAIKEFPECISEIRGTDSVAQLQFMDCKESLYKTTGVQLQGRETKLNVKQSWIAVLGPMAEVLFWAAVFVFGLMIYKTGTIELPFIQTIYEFPEKKEKK